MNRRKIICAFIATLTFEVDSVAAGVEPLALTPGQVAVASELLENREAINRALDKAGIKGSISVESGDVGGGGGMSSYENQADNFILSKCSVPTKCVKVVRLTIQTISSDGAKKNRKPEVNITFSAANEK